MPTITVDGQPYQVDEGVTEDMVRQHLAAQPQPAAPPSTAADIYKSAITSPASAIANLGALAAKAPTLPAQLYNRAMGEPNSQQLEDYFQRINKGAEAFKNFWGSNYQPQTEAGRVTQATGEGLTGAAATGGLGAANLITGAASGPMAEAGRWLAQKMNVPEWMGQYLGAAMPFGSTAVAGALSPASKVHGAVREAIESTHPGDVATMQAREQVAQQAGVPSMVWQNAPLRSPLREVGQQLAAAAKPSGEVQTGLRSLYGGTEGQHAGADTLEQFAQQNQGTPQANQAQALARALRSTDVLRGAGGLASEATKAGSHEAGEAALALDVLEPVLPSPVRSALGGMTLMRSGPIRRYMQSQGGKAADQLMSERTLAGLQGSLRNPRMDAFRQFLQGALVMPAAMHQTSQEQQP